MIRPSAILAGGLAALLLAGCAGVQVSRAPSELARISDVKIRADRLTITLTDGARCRMERPDGFGAWAGVTEGCGYALPFEVAFLTDRANPVRFVLEEGFEALDAPDLLMPRAEVRVRDVDGARRVFVSPMSNVRPRTEAAS